MTKEVILLIEDEVGLREFIQMYLTQKGYEVIVAEDGEHGLELLDSVSPELVVLDIEMPGMDGFKVCKEIRRKMTIPILFISCRKEVMDKVKGFELGGDDYLTKPFDFAELEARIQANLRQYKRSRQPSTDETKIIREGQMKIDTELYKCFIQGEIADLSTKEMKLLILLAENPNRIWSAEQLYDHIWGFDHTGDISTVKVHISRLRRKLENNPSEPEYIKTVRGFGYLFSSQSS